MTKSSVILSLSEIIFESLKYVEPINQWGLFLLSLSVK